MNSIRAFGFVLAIAVFCSSNALADPLTGVWKLNVAKSKPGAGGGAKSSTVRIESTGEGQKVKSEMVLQDGRKVDSEYEAKFDGREYPLKSTMGAGTVSLKKIDDRTIERTDRRDGIIYQVLTRVIAKDGKSFTVTVKDSGAVAVYEKQ